MSGAGVVLGSVEPFNGCKDEWPQYVERLEHFFVTNSVNTAEEKRATLLTLIGGATYKTLRNLVSPDKPGDKSYAQLVEALNKHYKPVPSKIVERFKFHSRNRKPGSRLRHSLQNYDRWQNFATLRIRSK